MCIYSTAGNLISRAYQGSTTSSPALMSSSSAFFTVGDYVHVVWTVDGSNWVFYKNGAVTDTTSSGQQPLSLTRAQHWIGRSAWSHDGYFNGTIAYLRFWHGQALDADQVAELYAARIEPTPAPTGAVAPTP